MNRRRTCAAGVFVMAGLLGACNQAPTPPPASAVAPVASHGTTATSGSTAEGTVLETMNASEYTYVRLKTAGGEIWAAATTFPVAVGDRLIVPLDSPMKDFHSATLKRDFPVIYFATAITHVGASAAGATPTAAAPAAPQAAANPDAPIAPVAPAAGGISIAKVWTDRKALAGKTVTIRGKIVKFNSNILGFDWTHVQDGSGDVKAGTNDITITSSPASVARVGDIVTVTGTVVLDKDFTAGYAYPVMIQNATIIVK